MAEREVTGLPAFTVFIPLGEEKVVVHDESVGMDVPTTIPVGGILIISNDDTKIIVV